MEFFLPSGENRAFPRTRLSLSCQLVVLSSQEVLHGLCINLSTTGAKVVLNHKVELGAQIKLRLTEHLGMEPFQAIAEVTRVMPAEPLPDDSLSSLPDTENILNSKSTVMRHEIGLKITELICAES
ncbi:PilZ domain-containing protein [Oceanospirillum maris]|uniref:PilZ domain-containing protein n=1 Tax=Oceanospirillum maris TaxID=64977 RepID=UPI000480F451|nr:PilZ domain-containing protein [Oceanospirillum maris]